jgi:hypothetical protein
VAARKSIVIVRTKKQAAAAQYGPAYQASVAAANKAKAQIARAKHMGGPPGALETLAQGRKKALPLVTPAQAVFPGSAKKRIVPAQPPNRVAHTGKATATSAPHPAVGTGKRVLPPPSATGAPKQVVTGNGKTQSTLPPHARSTPPYGGGNPKTQGSGRTRQTRVTPPRPTPTASPTTTTTTPVASTSVSSPTDPFAGLTPQQIVQQMLAPQYAPLDAQQKENDRIYGNEQGTLADTSGLTALAGTSAGPGSVPPEFVQALSSQQQAEAAYQHSVDAQKITAARESIAAQAPKLLYDLYNAQTTAQQNAAAVAAAGAVGCEHGAVPAAADQHQAVGGGRADPGDEQEVRARAAGARAEEQDRRGHVEVQVGFSDREAAQRQGQRHWLASGRNQIALKRVGIADRAEQRQVAALELKARSGGITGSQRLSLQRTAGKLAKEAFDGVPVKENGVVTGYNHGTYQGTIRDMLAAGIPLAIAQRALNAYWTSPGAAQEWETNGQGRPKVSFQERQQINTATRRRRGK